MNRRQYSVTASLVVKADSKEEAQKVVDRRLRGWFHETDTIPIGQLVEEDGFPSGTLLHYNTA